MIHDSETQRQLTSAFLWLRQGESWLREALFEHASLARIPAGQILCHDGGNCTQLPLLIGGSVRLYKLGENGREVTLYRIGAGESCVLTASCILSARPFPAFAVCEQDVEAVIIPHTEVRDWMTRSEPWRDFIFSLVAERLGEVFALLDALLFKPLDQRLATLLLQRARATRPETRLLRITHQALAVELGTSREVVTRILRDFESAGALRTGRGRIELLDLRHLDARAAVP